MTVSFLHHQALDIADDAYGSSVFAGNVIAGLFEDVDDLGVQKFGTGFRANTIQADIAEPVAEKQSGITAILNKHRAIGLTILRFDNQQEIVFRVFQNFIHILIGILRNNT